jgi:hypothetical protein
MRFTKVLAWPKLFALVTGIVVTSNSAFANSAAQIFESASPAKTTKTDLADYHLHPG